MCSGCFGFTGWRKFAAILLTVAAAILMGCTPRSDHKKNSVSESETSSSCRRLHGESIRKILGNRDHTVTGNIGSESSRRQDPAECYYEDSATSRTVLLISVSDAKTEAEYDRLRHHYLRNRDTATNCHIKRPLAAGFYCQTTGTMSFAQGLFDHRMVTVSWFRNRTLVGAEQAGPLLAEVDQNLSETD